MKKILIANDLLYGGGVERVLDELVKCLLKKEYEVTLMIPNCNKKDVEKLYGDKVHLRKALRYRKSLKKYSLAWFWDSGLFLLHKLAYRIGVSVSIREYDVAIALKEGRVMREVARIKAKKRYAWIHTDYTIMHFSKLFFKSDEDERKCMMQYDKVVCVSRTAKESVINTVGDPGNLCVRYNPIDYCKIREQAKTSCEMKYKKEGLLFVSVGRLAYPKNYSLLLDVCNELSKEYAFELWIVGDGPDREELQRKIKEYGLTCVRLLGDIPNPFPYLSQADAFISTSLSESYGLAVQESLILGVPVIAVKCPAMKETVDERFGLLPEGTYQSVKNAMESILESPDRLVRYREQIKEFYSVEDLYEKRLIEILALWES